MHTYIHTHNAIHKWNAVTQIPLTLLGGEPEVLTLERRAWTGTHRKSKRRLLSLSKFFSPIEHFWLYSQQKNPSRRRTLLAGIRWALFEGCTAFMELHLAINKHVWSGRTYVLQTSLAACPSVYLSVCLSVSPSGMAFLPSVCLPGGVCRPVCIPPDTMACPASPGLACPA